MKLPTYHVVATHGQAHRQTFEVLCEVTEWGCTARGQGPSRRAAEQVAAAAMLDLLKQRTG